LEILLSLKPPVASMPRKRSSFDIESLRNLSKSSSDDTLLLLRVKALTFLPSLSMIKQRAFFADVDTDVIHSLNLLF